MLEPILLRQTSGVCPTCLRVVNASVVSKDGAVYLSKECAAHGYSELKIWPDVQHYNWMSAFHFQTAQPLAVTTLKAGCPRDCGPCPDHLRRPTLVEIEVTRRCNLCCPVCFMSAEGVDRDPELEIFEQMFRNIREQAGTTPGIQLTGGEPTVRRDLPDIVRRGREAGFDGIEVNTNGVVISNNVEYLERLKSAGLTGIYLQFDGLNPDVYRRLRGANLLATKLKAIENCRRVGLQVVLAMTIIDGLNLGDLGDVLRFALENVDVVAGLALQPAFTSGRFEVGAPRRLSMGDIIFELAKQSDGLLNPYDFYPLGCSHPLCSCGSYLYQKCNSGFVSLSREVTPQQYADAFNQTSPQGSVLRDIAFQRPEAQGRGLSVVIMNYMDAVTIQLDRLRECSMVVATPDRRMLPFCSYHLTSCDGQRIHTACKSEDALVGVSS